MRRKKCTNEQCPLFKTGIEVPFSGRKDAEVIFCGESPGKEEEKAGKPFVGDSGELLKKICKEADISWIDVCIANSARCRIDKKVLSESTVKKVLDCCRPNVVSLMKQVKPKIVVAVGDIACRQVLKKKKITKLRGKWFESSEFNCQVYPVFHPAYILRNMALRPVLLRDMQTLSKAIDNDAQSLSQVVDRKNFDYREVDTLKGYLSKDDEVSIDTECQGLDWMSENFVMMSYSISNSEGTGRQVYLFEECEPGAHDFSIKWMRAINGTRKKEEVEVFVREASNFKRKVAELKVILESPIKKIMMHGNFDRHALYWLFVFYLKKEMPALNRYLFDVQSVANIIEENIYKLPSLSELQKAFTDREDDYKSAFQSQSYNEDMLAAARTAREDVTFYACSDTDVTLQVGQRMKDILKRPDNYHVLRYVAKFSTPCLNVLYEMEKNGALIDVDTLPDTLEAISEIMLTEQEAALALTPIAVRQKHEKKGLRLTRRELVADTLFSRDGFGVPPVKKSKNKTTWSVDKEVVKSLLENPLSGPDVQSYLRHLTEFNNNQVLSSRYLSGFIKHIKKDRRVHTHYSSATAVTGRIASSDPNLMNTPKRNAKSAEAIRRLFITEKGKILMAGDESQSELRWAAHVANETTMIEIFRKDEDIHVSTAQEMVNAPWSSLTLAEKKSARQKAKPVNFGLIFLMQAFGLVSYAKNEYGVTMTEEEAEEYIVAYFRKYPKLRDYHQRTIEFGREHGYVESPLGRRRHLPELLSPDRYLREEAERMAVNHPIQNPSSDTVILACSEILKMDIDPEEFRPILFVHDELIFEVKDNSKVADYAKIFRHSMTNPPLKRDFDVDLKVPLVCDIKVGPNLFEMKEFE